MSGFGSSILGTWYGNPELSDRLSVAENNGVTPEVWEVKLYAMLLHGIGNNLENPAKTAAVERLIGIPKRSFREIWHDIAGHGPFFQPRQHQHTLDTKIERCLQVVDDAFFGGWVDQAAPLNFSRFQRTRIAVELLNRVADESYIRQRQTTLCGLVTFMHGFARRFPDQYVDFVVRLCSDDLPLSIRINVKTDEPRDAESGLQIKLDRNSTILNGNDRKHWPTLAATDYIALSSLRANSNLVHYGEGATTPNELMRWMKDAGYQSVTNRIMSRFAHERNRIGRRENYLRRIKNVFRGHVQGMKALLDRKEATVYMVTTHDLTTEMLSGLPLGPQRLKIRDAERGEKLSTAFSKFKGKVVDAFGGHYLLVRGADIFEDGVEFDIVTWGRHTAQNKTRISWSKLGRWYRGYIYGIP